MYLIFIIAVISIISVIISRVLRYIRDYKEAYWYLLDKYEFLNGAFIRYINVINCLVPIMVRSLGLTPLPSDKQDLIPHDIDLMRMFSKGE